MRGVDRNSWVEGVVKRRLSIEQSSQYCVLLSSAEASYFWPSLMTVGVQRGGRRRHGSVVTLKYQIQN